MCQFFYSCLYKDQEESTLRTLEQTTKAEDESIADAEKKLKPSQTAPNSIRRSDWSNEISPQGAAMSHRVRTRRQPAMENFTKSQSKRPYSSSPQ